MKDKYVIAALLGAAATLAAEGVSLLLVALGLGNIDTYRIDSLFITVDRPSWAFGCISAGITGGAVGAMLWYLLERFGSGGVIVKSVMLSLFAWFGLKLYCVAFIEGRFADPRPFAVYYNHLLSAAANGLALGALLRWTLLRRGKQG